MPFEREKTNPASSIRSKELGVVQFCESISLTPKKMKIVTLQHDWDNSLHFLVKPLKHQNQVKKIGLFISGNLK